MTAIVKPLTIATSFLTVVFLIGSCDFQKKTDDEKKHQIFYDETGNHESPHPHVPDIGKSKPEPEDEPIRVRDQSERDKMKKYIAEFVRPQDIVTSIIISPGDTCDCVAVGNQPTLRKIELKEHKIRFDPPVLPIEEQKRDVTNQFEKDPATKEQVTEIKLEYGSNGKICPKNTIPIRRLSMDILDNFETLDDFFRARPPHNVNGPTDEHQYAFADFSGNNWGAQSTLNIWPPYTEKASEFSLSQIGVERGSGNNRETVEVGWQKFRNLYGDYEPRLFIYFTPDNYGSGGCYNLTCSGFVQVNNSVYIGGGFTNISSHPHPSTAWEFTIRWQRHSETGDWWLKYGDTWVGYYPSELFDNNGLRPRSSRIAFFGEIIDDTKGSRHTRTDMGSGHFPSSGFGYAAYQRRLRTITTGNAWNTYPSLSISRTDADCYDITQHSSSGSWERYIYFGGPGYNNHCQ